MTPADALRHARALLDTWVGAAYVSLTSVTRLFLLYPVFISVHVIGVTMLVGTRRTREVLVLSAVSIIVNLVVSVALTPSRGIAGVVIGTLIGYAVVWVPYLRLMCREFDLTLREWIGAVVLPNVAPTGAQLIMGRQTIRLAERSDQLWQVVLLVGASCGLSWAVFLLGSLGRDERRSLLGSGRRFRASEEPSGS